MARVHGGSPQPLTKQSSTTRTHHSTQCAGAPCWAGRDVLRLHLSVRSSWRVLPPSFHRCQTGFVVCSLSLLTPLPFIFHKRYWWRIPYDSNSVLASVSWITHMPQTHILWIAKSNGHPKSYSCPEYGRFRATKRTPVGVFSHKRVKNN